MKLRKSLLSIGLMSGVLVSGACSFSPGATPLLAQSQNVHTAWPQPINLSGLGGSAAHPLTFKITQSPAHGTLSGPDPATPTYTPDTGYTGPDQFQFTVSDGSTESSSGTISIMVGPFTTTPAGRVLYDQNTQNFTNYSYQQKNSGDTAQPTANTPFFGYGTDATMGVISPPADGQNPFYLPMGHYANPDGSAGLVLNEWSPAAGATEDVSLIPEINFVPWIDVWAGGQFKSLELQVDMRLPYFTVSPPMPNGAASALMAGSIYFVFWDSKTNQNLYYGGSLFNIDPQIKSEEIRYDCAAGFAWPMVFDTMHRNATYLTLADDSATFTALPFPEWRHYSYTISPQQFAAGLHAINQAIAADSNTCGVHKTPYSGNPSDYRLLLVQLDAEATRWGGAYDPLNPKPTDAGAAMHIQFKNWRISQTLQPKPPLVAGDYNGDGKSDTAVWRPSDGTWYLKNIGATPWGNSTDIPVPGDYDGDRKADLAVYRPNDPGGSTWYLTLSRGGTQGVQWGSPNDIPVPGDYDGDGKTDEAVYRPADAAGGTWYLKLSGGGTQGVQWGSANDIPVPGDYDGDGKTDLAVFRPNDPGGASWYLKLSGGGTQGVQWGSPNDIPVPGDYDGDGKTDLALYRPTDAAGGTWYLKLSGGGTQGVQWGSANDIPVPGDYDGDGKTDLAVFRPNDPGGATWYLKLSGGGTQGVQWGSAGDIPVVSRLIRLQQIHGMSDPDLSGINGRTFSLNDTITLTYGGNATAFNWEFNPPEAGRTSSPGVGGHTARASVVTATPRFNLGTLSLPPGPYTVRVQAVNGSQQSNWGTASISLASSDLANTRVYPNPFRSSRGDTILTFDQMPANSSVKIFTVSGRWVRTLQAPSGMVPWDLTNDTGERVASGLYLYAVTDGQGNKTRGKFTLIR